jgi:hypothetical protein
MNHPVENTTEETLMLPDDVKRITPFISKSYLVIIGDKNTKR